MKKQSLAEWLAANGSPWNQTKDSGKTVTVCIAYGNLDVGSAAYRDLFNLSDYSFGMLCGATVELYIN
jgi:hypothetical protein